MSYTHARECPVMTLYHYEEPSLIQIRSLTGDVTSPVDRTTILGVKT
jgi:hypothetical protein